MSISETLKLRSGRPSLSSEGFGAALSATVALADFAGLPKSKS